MNAQPKMNGKVLPRRELRNGEREMGNGKWKDWEVDVQAKGKNDVALFSTALQ